jgi:chromate transporter
MVYFSTFIHFYFCGRSMDRKHPQCSAIDGALVTAITAAVVGVVCHLALFFGYHVLWPDEWNGAFDWPSSAIALAATIALFRYKTHVIYVIAASGLAGMCIRWFYM